MPHVVATLTQSEQFRRVYADAMKADFGASGILQAKIPFRNKERTGESYRVPILTRRVQGGNYANSSAGQVNFGDIVSSKIVQAEVKGSQFFMSNGLDWESAFSGEKGNGPRSYTSEFDIVCRDLWDSSRFRVEMLLLWGQNPLGTIGQIDGAPVGNVFKVRTAECAPGILYNLEGATLTIRDVANLATTRAGTHVVTAVNPETREVTVTAIGAAVDGDVVFFADELPSGSAVFNTGPGLMKWAANSAGVLGGIDSTTNVVWRPTSKSLGNDVLTFDAILSASVNLQVRGHVGKVCCLTSPESWADAMNDMSATVRRTPQEKKYVLGAEAIEFHTGVGTVEVIAHPYMKRGYSVVFPLSTPGLSEDGKDAHGVIDGTPIRRVGAQDLAFVGPDGTSSESKRQSYFANLQRTNLLYLDTYSHQTIFPVSPGRLVRLTNIVPTITGS